jgi:hypothetical protein
MKKLTFLITLPLVACLALFLGMANKPDISGKPLKSQLKLIEPLSQNLQINCSDLSKGAYFIDELRLNKTDILDNKVCFFLNRDFIFTEFTLDDTKLVMKEYGQFGKNLLAPVIDSLNYFHVSRKCKLYRLDFPQPNELPETFTVKLKYHLVDENYRSFVKIRNASLIISGNSFWYPRNYLRDENLALTVKTTDRLAFSLDGKAMDYVMTQTYAKEYRHSFTDRADNPAAIIFKYKS